MNFPTRIYPNAANTSSIVTTSAINTIYDEIELALIDIIREITNRDVIDKDKDLELPMLQSVEILMDLEERFIEHFIYPINGIHSGKSKVDDDLFTECKSFNDMMQLIRRSI